MTECRQWSLIRWRHVLCRFVVKELFQQRHPRYPPEQVDDVSVTSRRTIDVNLGSTATRPKECARRGPECQALYYTFEELMEPIGKLGEGAGEC